MTAVRRLAAAGGGGSVTLPPPSIVALAAAPNSGHNQLTVPSAIAIDATHTGVGYVDGSGNVECIVYDHAAETVAGPYTIHASFEADTHSSPAFLRRPDGRWLCFYSLHNGPTFNVRLSTGVDDWSAWGSATNLDSELGGANYTDYLVVPHLTTNLLVYRDEPTPGTDSRWNYSTNASPDVTGWNAQTLLYREAGARSYLSGWGNGSRTDFVVTNGTFTKLGHFYADGTWRRSDGTDMGSPPFDFSDVTEIYSGTSPFIWGLSYATPTRPAIAGRDGTSDLYIRQQTGGSWQATSLGSCGTGYEYNGPGTGFISYGACIDDGDPDRMLRIEDVNGQPEVMEYTTADEGATFGARNLSAGSSELRTQLIPVRNPLSGLRAVLSEGPFVDYTDWTQAMLGVA